MIRTCLATAATAVLAVLLLAATAQAQTVTRAWVSGHGTDSTGCGAPTAPCRSLQYAHDHVVTAGSEIDVLDPAGYGAITITKAINIINDGVGTAGVQATAGAAITINAGGANVILRGLTIEGVGASDGVRLISGGSLRVLDSTIEGFTNTGLLYQPTASGHLYVSNTRIIDSGFSGVDVNPVIGSGSATVLVTLARVEAINDSIGLYVDGRASSQGVSVNVTLADSVVADCMSWGVTATTNTASAFVMVRNSSVVNSGSAANALFAGSVVDVAHSTLTGNGEAFDAFDGGVIGSYGDNNTDGNAVLGSTPTLVAFH